MKVIVGLGNPGGKYAGTRHNVGFEVVDYLAAAPGVSPFRSQFHGLCAETSHRGEKLLLLKPDTFMNLSGRAVRAALDFYKLDPAADLLVISDDFNLPLGKLRARANGSHGGQNGLRNIQEQLATDAYARLRIGVGQPSPGEAVDFVLSKFKPVERPAVEEAVAAAAKAALAWVTGGISACSDSFSPPPPPKPPRPVSREAKPSADPKPKKTTDESS